MARLADKVAIVTGAGSSGPGWGTGKATAVRFAREGARVLLVDRLRSAVEETASIIRDEGGVAEIFEADVTVAANMRGMAEAVVQQFGGLDILYHNVGIGNSEGVVEESEESWERVIRVNQTGLFLAAKHCIPLMQRRGQGTIVAVSSITANRWTGFPCASYTSSKAAMIALVRNIALQYAAEGIRANTISPGFLDTPMARGALSGIFASADDFVAQRSARCPSGSMGDAWDVASAALFLASDEARYITGTELVIDGGLTAATR